MKWQEVKDMFRDEVGDVTYVQLFSDEDDKPRGCGILEFASEDLVRKAIDKMHRRELSGGRKLVVKEDFDIDRDRYGRIIRGSGSGRDGRERATGLGAAGGGAGRDRERDRERRRDDRSSMGGGGGGGGGGGAYGNTYGLSPQFLDSLGVEGPLHTRLFVANVSGHIWGRGRGRSGGRDQVNTQPRCLFQFFSWCTAWTRGSCARCSAWRVGWSPAS